MKITKAQGRACLRSAEFSARNDTVAATSDAWDAMDMAIGVMCERGRFNGTPHFLTALCLCAAIAGVRP